MARPSLGDIVAGGRVIARSGEYVTVERMGTFGREYVAWDVSAGIARYPYAAFNLAEAIHNMNRRAREDREYAQATTRDKE